MRVVVSGTASASHLDDNSCASITDPALLRRLDRDGGGIELVAELLGEGLEDLGLAGGAIELRFTQETGLRVQCAYDAPRALDDGELRDLLEVVTRHWLGAAGGNFEPEAAGKLDLVVTLDANDRLIEVFDEDDKKLKELRRDHRRRLNSVLGTECRRRLVPPVPH